MLAGSYLMVNIPDIQYSTSWTNVQLEGITFVVLTGGDGGVGDASISTYIKLIKKGSEGLGFFIRTVGSRFSCSPVFIKFAEGSTDWIRIR